MSRIRYVIADDHAIFRDGIKMVLGKSDKLELAGEASNGMELIEVARQSTPDVVITDIKMPVMDGIEATRQLRSHFPLLPVVALSMFNEDDLVMEMLEAGATGYLLKNAGRDEILEAIETVMEGKNYYCRSTSTRLAAIIGRKRRHIAKQRNEIVFGSRELEVIELVCREYSTKEIAEKLCISSRTVEGVRLRVCEKMQVKNTAGLVIFAIQHHLFDPDKVET